MHCSLIPTTQAPDLTRALRRLLRLASTNLLLVILGGCAGGSGDDITLTGNDGDGTDPAAVDIAFAYVVRPLPTDPDEQDDKSDPLAFSPGARLIARERASASAPAINLTTQIASIVAAELGVASNQLAIDIKDLDVSFDGEILLFAARIVPEPIDDNLEDTTWNLWQYNFKTGGIGYVIPAEAIRNEAAVDGSSQDIGPHFLPDGRIVFSSSRQSDVWTSPLHQDSVVPIKTKGSIHV